MTVTRWGEVAKAAASDVLFNGMFDEAAVFPPGNATMDHAVRRYLAWRSSARSRFVGPFICSTTRWEDLVSRLPAGAAVDVSLTVPEGAEALRAAVAHVSRHPAVNLVSVEVPAPVDAVEVAVDVLDSVLPPGATAYVELPLSALDDATCRLLAQRPHRLKMRTGGTTADAFPTDAELARALRQAVGSRLPFKLTAGLHHAVRHRDPETGFEHHGFLNVVLATAAALDGSDADAVEAALARRDPEHVASEVRRLDPGRACAVRQRFLSFGTCSIDEPLHDLTTLGLLQEAQP
jgi:hypothetical protein